MNMGITRFILSIDGQCLLLLSECIFSRFLKLKKPFVPFSVSVLLFALKAGKRTKNFRDREKSITYFGHRFKATNDVHGAGTRDEPPRTSAWEAMVLLKYFGQ